MKWKFRTPQILINYVLYNFWPLAKILWKYNFNNVANRHMDRWTSSVKLTALSCVNRRMHEYTGSQTCHNQWKHYIPIGSGNRNAQEQFAIYWTTKLYRFIFKRNTDCSSCLSRFYFSHSLQNNFIMSKGQVIWQILPPRRMNTYIRTQGC